MSDKFFAAMVSTIAYAILSTSANLAAYRSGQVVNMAYTDADYSKQVR